MPCRTSRSFWLTRMCFPQKQVNLFTFHFLHLIPASALRHSSSFSRFSVPDRLHLPRPESVFAIFPDSGSHLLVSLQRDPRVRPASASQYTLLTPHTLLPAAWPVGAGRNWAPAGPHHSSGTARLSLESKHTHIGPCRFHHPYFYLLVMKLYCVSHHVNLLHSMNFFF